MDMDFVWNGKKMSYNELKEYGDLKKRSSALFFKEYMESQGFRQNHYEQILELNQDVLGSVSLLLNNYQQFLLSSKVTYDDLHRANIMGAYGYVEENGLFVPKTIEADAHFFGGYLPKVPYKRHWYEYPKIGEDFCEYDVTISKGISKEDNFDLILKSDMDLFLGDVLVKNTEDYEIQRQQLLNQLNQIKDNSRDNFCISYDYNSTTNSEFILLSRKK